MVWHRAAEGQDIAFLRPEQPVRPDLARHSPDLLPLLSTALGGPLDLRELQTALDRLLSLHRFCQAFLASRGLALAPARPWQPHREGPATPRSLTPDHLTCPKTTGACHGPDAHRLRDLQVPVKSQFDPTTGARGTVTINSMLLVTDPCFVYDTIEFLDGGQIVFAPRKRTYYDNYNVICRKLYIQGGSAPKEINPCRPGDPGKTYDGNNVITWLGRLQTAADGQNYPTPAADGTSFGVQPVERPRAGQ
jgi:hypothetical protein